MSTPSHGSASRKPWFLTLARRYGRRRLSSCFEGVWVSGLARAADVRRQPSIVAANHVSWWDPFLVVLIDELLGTESYCLMDTENLDRYPYFGWIGAVPIERRSRDQALQDLEAAARLLDRPGRVLWIFPQGRQRPAHLRPLQLRPGVEKLAAWTGAPVMPLALSYRFRQSPWLAAFGSLGAALEAPTVESLERSLCEALDRIDQLCDRGAEPDLEGFARVLRGRGGGPETRAGGRLLSMGSQRSRRPRGDGV